MADPFRAGVFDSTLRPLAPDRPRCTEAAEINRRLRGLDGVELLVVRPWQADLHAKILELALGTLKVPSSSRKEDAVLNDYVKQARLDGKCSRVMDLSTLTVGSAPAIMEHIEDCRRAYTNFGIHQATKPWKGDPKVTQLSAAQRITMWLGAHKVLRGATKRPRNDVHLQRTGISRPRKRADVMCLLGGGWLSAPLQRQPHTRTAPPRRPKRVVCGCFSFRSRFLRRRNRALSFPGLEISPTPNGAGVLQGRRRCLRDRRRGPVLELGAELPGQRRRDEPVVLQEQHAHHGVQEAAAGAAPG